MTTLYEYTSHGTGDALGSPSSSSAGVMPSWSSALPAGDRGRRGFTLIELLVVIGIIMLLAGMGFGVFTVVRNQAKLTQCTNNLQNLGIGIKGFQLEDRKGGFPPSLRELFEPGMALAGEAKTKILICPFDTMKGTNPLMGRPVPQQGATNWGDISNLFENGSSYTFEVSGVPLRAASPNQIDWFFDTSTTPSWGEAPGTTPTWAEGKLNGFNNKVVFYDRSGTRGEIVRPRASAFPIVRDFHHFQWAGNSHDEKTKKVLNLSWALGVFWSIPYWELDYQP